MLAVPTHILYARFRRSASFFATVDCVCSGARTSIYRVDAVGIPCNGFAPRGMATHIISNWANI